MRMIILLSGLFLMLGKLTLVAQIPNHSFEEWTSIHDYEKPDHWQTNQDTFYTRIFKDTTGIDGQYAMRMESSTNSAWVDCRSIALTTVQFDQPLEENRSLYFYLRSIPEDPSNSTFLNVSGVLIDGQNAVGSYSWTNDEVFENYRMIEIPFQSSGVDSMSIQVIGGAQNGPTDGCIGSSTSWVDQFHIAESSATDVKTIRDNSLTIYPNPAHGEIHLSGDISDIERYELHNILGQKLQEGALRGSSIKLEAVGTLFLVLEHSDGQRRVYKLVNQSDG